MAGVRRWRRPFGGSNRKSVRSGGGILAAACLLVAAVFSGVVLWLTLTAEDTMLDLRARADRAALTVEIAIARPPTDAVGSLEDTTSADGDATPATDTTLDDLPVSDDPEPPSVPPESEAATASDVTDQADPTGDGMEAVETPPPSMADDAPEVDQDEDGSETADAAPEVEPADGADGVQTADIADVTEPAEDAAEIGSDVPLAAVLPVALPVTVAGPDPALLDLTDVGPLPRIGDDGLRPRDAYARPFDVRSRQPRVAIVVTHLGLSASETNAAIGMLPGAVTLAFSPYADDLDDWLAAARAEGHETLVMLPMQPAGFPLNDPGPNTLLGHLPEEENRGRLEWALSRTAGYPGVTNLMGAELADRPDILRMLMQWLNERGLFYLDSLAVPRPAVADVALEVGIPYVANDRKLDVVPEPAAIDRALEALESLALDRGYAVGVTNAFPVSLNRIQQWASGLEDRGLVLAPVSAIANPSVDG